MAAGQSPTKAKEQTIQVHPDVSTRSVGAVAYFVMLAVLGWMAFNIDNMKTRMTRIETLVESGARRSEDRGDILKDHEDRIRALEKKENGK